MVEAIISTAATACQDCYRCVRECPVKAIRVRDSVAQVVDERCIKCGHCVAVCPNEAKQVRDDLPAVRAMLADGQAVYVSLAPSWVAAWPDLPAAAMIHALQSCGFAGVGETALGAQEVSAHTAAMLEREPERSWVSSACPAAADWVRRYHGRSELVTPLLSPLLAHCRMLRSHFGPDIRIVFCGPCVAKKVEADRHPELLDAALTFDEVRVLLAERGLDPAALALPDPAPDYVLAGATDGAWYPVEGGMLAGLRSDCRPTDATLMAVSGMESVREAVEDLDQQGGCFLELLACRGGCVAGPCAGGSGGGLVRRRRVLAAAPAPTEAIPRAPALAIEDSAVAEPVDLPQVSDEAITRQLAAVGKYSSEDELNCGGCGYDSCRQFAQAAACGLAEPSMCVSYMRRLAQNKANTLLRAMPSGALLVDEQLRIVESNAACARLFPAAAQAVAGGDLSGTRLADVLPCAALFRHVLQHGEDIIERDVRVDGRVLSVSVFTVEAGRLVAGIMRDITEPAVQREEIARRARLVIERQLETVQQIAGLLGENAAESEVTLGTLIDALQGPVDGRG